MLELRSAQRKKSWRRMFRMQLRRSSLRGMMTMRLILMARLQYVKSPSHKGARAGRWNLET